MSEHKKKWEYAVWPLEFGEPYWDTKGNHAQLNTRSAAKGGTWLNSLGEEGWELINILPTTFTIKDQPEEYKKANLNNVYFGIFKRES
jgi:hypothetical protein